MDISFDAEVHCIDGLVGRPLTKISDPTTKKVTHLVVAEDKPPHTKRLVPIDLVKETTPDFIYLNCTEKEFYQTEQLEKILVHPTNGHVTHLVLKLGQVWT